MKKNLRVAALFLVLGASIKETYPMVSSSSCGAVIGLAGLKCVWDTANISHRAFKNYYFNEFEPRITASEHSVQVGLGGDTIQGFLKKNAVQHYLDPAQLYLCIDVTDTDSITVQSFAYEDRAVIECSRGFFNAWHAAKPWARSSLNARLEKSVIDIKRGVTEQSVSVIKRGCEDPHLFRSYVRFTAITSGTILAYALYKISVPSVVSVPTALTGALYLNLCMNAQVGRWDVSIASAISDLRQGQEKTSCEYLKECALEQQRPDLFEAYVTSIPPQDSHRPMYEEALAQLRSQVVPEYQQID